MNMSGDVREVIVHCSICFNIHGPGCANDLVTRQFSFYRQYGSDSLRTSGDLVRPLSNNDAACYESSSSLVKHRSEKRPACFQFASPWCEN